MDTRLKKFNSTLILKIVAFMLCICCTVNCTTQVMTSLYKASDSDIIDDSYEDALYELIMIDRELTETETFKYHMSRFSGIVDTMTGSYGDGSEAAYKQWKSSIGTSNEAYYKKAKKNIISHIIADEFRLYLALVDEGVVEPLGMLEVSEYSGNTVDIYEEDCYMFFDYYSFDDLCNNEADGVVIYPKDEKLKKKAQELDADGVFQLKNYYQILTEDTYNEEEVVTESYKPGYYAFKINDEALKNKLTDYSLFVIDRYGSAEEFAKHYNRYADELKKYYPSGKYFIRDSSGKVYTNIKGLDSKSNVKEIEEKFASFGFYCQKREYGDMYLPDGKYYFQGAYSAYWMDDDGVYETTTLPDVVTTTVVPVETTMVHTTIMAEKVVDGEKVTAPVAAEPTTYKIDAFSSTPFVDENDGWYCMLGVDMYPDDYADTDLFKTSRFQIETAKEILSDALFTIGLMGVLFLVCFIYLIARAGRRKGSEEIHLLKTDRIFTEIRIAFDGLVGFGVFMLGVWTIDEFEGEDREVFTKLLSILAALFAAVVLDLVLFIVRQIKAKTLLKNTFIGWLVIKCFGALWRKIKKIRSSYKEKIKPFIKENLLYTREFKKGTLIRIGIVVAVNVALIFFGTIEAVDNFTCFLLVLCLLFDIGVILWVIRLIGGLHKIFSALEEIRQGNYSVYINTFALPSTLRESAEKVMSLRDGLKTAVEEAVRQEQTKTELITNVSHDLKTPLTSIINYVELLKKCDITDDNAKEYLAVLGEKSDRLKKLIEDLVEASKASTGNIKVDFVQVSLNEMVSQLLGEHTDGLDRKKLNVIAEIPEESVTVKADGKLLYRVMENLIVNVEKYSLFGTRVYVTVENEGAYGTVTFKNISEQPLNITADQLKERFVRGDESRSTEGNGLGLSIAQSLCEVQGGELEISISGDLFTASVKLKN